MPAIDKLSGYASGTTGASDTYFAIAPSDAADLPFRTRAVLATGAGVVAAVCPTSGETVVLPVASGAPLPIRTDRIKATGTTATGLVGLA